MGDSFTLEKLLRFSGILSNFLAKDIIYFRMSWPSFG